MCTWGLEQRGENSSKYLLEAGIKPAYLDLPLWRGSTHDMAKLIQILGRVLKDETLGFAGQPTPIGSFEFAVKLAVEGKNVADGLTRAIHFYNLVNSSIQTEYEDAEDGFVITVSFPLKEGEPNRFLGLIWMVVFHRFSSWLAGDTLLQSSIDLNHCPSKEQAKELKKIFPFNHKYNATSLRLILDRYLVKAPIQRSSQNVKEMLTQAPLDMMLLSDRDLSMYLKVRRLLATTTSMPTQEIAQKINIHPSKLRRLLKQEGKKVSVIREEVRQEKARSLLAMSNFSIEAISDELGYGDASSFTRAFRTWTSFSPSEYRKSERYEHAPRNGDSLL